MLVCDAHAKQGHVVQVTARESGYFVAKYNDNVVVQVTLCVSCSAHVLDDLRRFLGLGEGKVRF